jgi:hypothetical protein
VIAGPRVSVTVVFAVAGVFAVIGIFAIAGDIRHFVQAAVILILN